MRFFSHAHRNISLRQRSFLIYSSYTFIINPRSIKNYVLFCKRSFSVDYAQLSPICHVFIVTRLINREIFAFDKRCFSIDYLRDISILFACLSKWFSLPTFSSFRYSFNINFYRIRFQFDRIFGKRGRSLINKENVESKEPTILQRSYR